MQIWQMDGPNYPMASLLAPVLIGSAAIPTDQPTQNVTLAKQTQIKHADVNVRKASDKGVKHSEKTFNNLAFDSAKGKITQCSIEEVRTALDAEKAGLIGKTTSRGIPGDRLESGFEFTNKICVDVDVKAFRINSLSILCKLSMGTSR